MRNQNKKNRGLSLTELLVVMSVMLILMAIAMPVAKKLFASLENSTGPANVISAAMANARAIAIREQTYAGVRFQQDISGRQYIVLIIHDEPATKLANGFRAMHGKKPMALPEETGIIAGGLYADAGLNSTAGMTNATTFSVIFSPSGKFVVHPVRVRNGEGKIDSDSPASSDKVFNVQAQVASGYAMLVQDDYPSLGLDEESSVSSFIVYEKKAFDKIPVNARWSGFFSTLDREFVNPHTGELVKK